MAKDLKGLNSVTTNTLTVGDVKIDNSGINAGNKKITNVAAGDISANSTDAVNGGAAVENKPDNQQYRRSSQ